MSTAARPSGRPASPIVMIPARMASTRLPGKPLADILGAPMIVHVMHRAMESEIGPVVVACAEPEIARAVEAAGGTAVLTRPDHPSGSDRIFEALRLIDPEGRHDAVVNVQGDLPTIEPESVRAVFAPLADPGVDIATLVVEITRQEERSDPNVVKAVLELPQGARQGRALYFTRATAPSGDGPLYHHIGLYAYRRAALERFVALPPSALEQRERLEQLRALSNGMRIDAAVVDAVPLGVDTPADLERARALLSGRKAG
ncbi:3-deoxy-manno-octulosonate cytidylyltransferase [Azospirillum thiophilum]|uniref:3-deoxy-manno-octulosonate cytidylyltransferase n=1 Tax=Azospirillum thiophilum TaxID=528244 RepID=A0AAC9EX56_9PROT|nr:3-deoxy-manno-octulosonate cytidylyltransferase [Azospirillum thiophilum]ALG70567.1 3-deoxy-manno-octulosonate cytidylyltransferase [Azospirillum thiophilum]KJR65762.1 3-deoxy-manno-octulosonate cytidylyltransferase [Azospirillum thiophilum]